MRMKSELFNVDIPPNSALLFLHTHLWPLHYRPAKLNLLCLLILQPLCVLLRLGRSFLTLSGLMPSFLQDSALATFPPGRVPV